MVPNFVNVLLFHSSVNLTLWFWAIVSRTSDHEISLLRPGTLGATEYDGCCGHCSLKKVALALLMTLDITTHKYPAVMVHIRARLCFRLGFCSGLSVDFG
jgi:hypothetical protein